MKSRLALILVVSTALLGIPVYAQHGHGGGGGASMSTHGHSMDSHSADSHATASSSTRSEGKQSIVSERLSDNTKLSGKLQSLLLPFLQRLVLQGFRYLDIDRMKIRIEWIDRVPGGRRPRHAEGAD